MKITSRLAIFSPTKFFLSFFCQLLFCFSIAAVEISDFIGNKEKKIRINDHLTVFLTHEIPSEAGSNILK